MPSAKIDSDTAAISRRYSRNLKGASTRQPPASRTGCSISNCVLTTRWWRSDGGRVHRFSGRRDRRNGAIYSHFFARTWVWARVAQESVGEVRRPALLEGARAFAEVG